MATKVLDSLATSVFCENLAMMLAAGINSDEAVSLLVGDSQDGPFFEAARDVSDRMSNGETLADAMRGSGRFPIYAVSSVQAGETSGRTEQTLRALANHYAEQSKIESRISSAIVYPTVLLLLMTAILAVMVFAVLPTFSSVYVSLSGDVTASAYSYIRVANVICWIALIVAAVLAVLFLALAINAAAGGDSRRRVFHILQKLPRTRRAMRQMACARFTSTYAIYIASGINTDDAFAKTMESVDDPGFLTDCRRCKDLMDAGKSVGSAAYDSHLFEPLYARMLISGLKSGDLEGVLAHLSSLFYEDAKDRFNGMINALEPALAGFLTVAVGLALVAVMLPLVGIMGGIG